MTTNEVRGHLTGAYLARKAENVELCLERIAKLSELTGRRKLDISRFIGLESYEDTLEFLIGDDVWEYYVVTYGTSKNQPFKGGWTNIIARSEYEAIKLHARQFGYTKDGLGRYCDIYNFEEFKKTSMWRDGNNLGAAERAYIDGRKELM